MTPNPGLILDLMEAFRRSKTLFAAVELGVFDLLAQGPAEAWQIARPEVSVDALTRLLDACVSLGLLVKDGESYANTEVANVFLRRESPSTLTGYIRYSDSVLYPMWGNLGDAVREGGHRWKQTFGLEGSLFSHFYRTEEARYEFLLGMHGIGMLASPEVVAAFDLSRFSRMIDLGGGTGHLALAAKARYPKLAAAVFDLPDAVVMAGRFLAGSAVEIFAGDFFADALPAADLYAVGRILHDWPEEKIRPLLGKICDALPAAGGLLIAEKLLDDDLAGPCDAHMQSLNMLVCTNGRERSFAQYAGLLTEAGFSEIRGKRTGSPLDAVLAVK